MKSINDLRIVDFDYLVAKDNQVALRYSAEGSHSGAPYKGTRSLSPSNDAVENERLGIDATGRKAKWTAAGLFKLNSEGKITL